MTEKITNLTLKRVCLRSPLACFLSSGLILALLLLNACGALNIPIKSEGCNFRTYTNMALPDYLKSRYHYRQPVRMAVIPFDVPENFAPYFPPAGQESLNFGKELARKFQLELRRAGELNIVELFNRDRWPGKREEFFQGNYHAIQLARDAGYQLVMVGMLEDIKNESDLTVHTKIIDTTDNVTIWDGKTVVHSGERGWRRSMSKALIGEDRPDLFHFPERTERLVVCTVDKIMTGDLVPE